MRSDAQASGHVAYTNRVAALYRFEPYEAESELYELVSAYLQRDETIAFGSPPNPLVLTVARKILASSTAATAGFLRTVLSRPRRAEATDVESLEDVVDTAAFTHDLDRARGDGEPCGEARLALIDSSVAALLPDLDDEIAEVEQYLAKAEAIHDNAKGDKLVEVLPSVLERVSGLGGRRKALILVQLKVPLWRGPPLKATYHPVLGVHQGGK